MCEYEAIIHSYFYRPPTRYQVVFSGESVHDQSIIDHSKQYTETNPFESRVIENKRLTMGDHFQDVRHITFDISNSSGQPVLNYEPGDVLAMWPKNNFESVMHILKRFNISPDQTLKITKFDSGMTFLIN
jgi:sulfite reductase alpha subunit-like flavoprotein